MTRSRKKTPKAFICTGTNTLFYRMKRREARARNRQNLRTAMSTDDPDALVQHFKPIRDTWSEPTDGSWIPTAHDVQQGRISEEWYKKLFRK